MVERYYIDNGLQGILCKDTQGDLWNSFLDSLKTHGIILEDKRVFFATDIFLFLEFIGLGKILEEVPLKKLHEDIKHNILRLFKNKKTASLNDINSFLDDSLKQCFNMCKSLPEITPTALATKHKTQLGYYQGNGANFLDNIISSSYLQSLKQHPTEMHEKICLHLAWQVLAIILRTIFTQVSTKDHPDLILRLFEPLMATIHDAIVNTNVQPNFFRLAEAAYLSIMRQGEKNLKSSDLLWIQEYRQNHQTRKKGDLGDSIYLDRAILGHLEMENGEIKQYPVTVLTIDNPLDVVNRLKLFLRILEKLPLEVIGWGIYPVYSCKVVCLTQIGNQLIYKETIEHAVLNP